MRGQRFTVNLDESEPQKAKIRSIDGSGLVSDIKERATSGEAIPPSQPRINNSATGFPAHKDRLKASRCKQGKQKEFLHKHDPKIQKDQIQIPEQGGGLISPSHGEVYAEQDGGSNANFYADIHAENRKRIADMPEGEILAAKEQLISGLSPSLIEKLLKKANIDDTSTPFSDESNVISNAKTAKKEQPAKQVKFENADPSQAPSSLDPRSADLRSEELPPLHPPLDLQPAASTQPLPPLPNIHFPKAPAPPDLDPEDPNFLSKLHSTYFPSLPSDPSSLSWMQPINPKEQTTYSPSQEALPASSLRFDFRGHLLPPRLSSQVPPTKGLHHHGHAPASAGYTIPELARLARSTVASQRCIAYQTLGRILYRLGRGDFGAEGEDLCEGLWGLIEKGKVLEGIIETASKEDEGNRTVWAIATDAVWLWRKGGGRRWQGR